MIKLRILRWEIILDYPGGPKEINHKDAYKRETGGLESEEIGRCYAAGFEDGGRGHEPRDASGF